jgi:hypothetical protein
MDYASPGSACDRGSLPEGRDYTRGPDALVNFAHLCAGAPPIQALLARGRRRTPAGRFEHADRTRPPDAQHQALEDAEVMVEIAALDICGREVQPHGHVQILPAAIDQQRGGFG